MKRLIILTAMIALNNNLTGQDFAINNSTSADSVQYKHPMKTQDVTILKILNIQDQILENMTKMIGLLYENQNIPRKKTTSFTNTSLNTKMPTEQNIQDKQLSIEDLRNADTYFSIEKALQSPKSVFKLDLSKNALTSVPEEIKQFKNLQKLVLSDNLIEEIPDWIVELKALQYFYLSNNRLEKFPKQLTELDSMILIDLSCNPIWYGTLGIKGGENLEVLNLHDTNINYKEMQHMGRRLGAILIK
jgi:Leucine-rich repeat (LRR) protein